MRVVRSGSGICQTSSHRLAMPQVAPQAIESPTPSVFLWPGYALFFLMVYLPVSINALMTGMVALVLNIVLFRCLVSRKGLEIHPTVLKWAFYYSLLGSVYVSFGLAMNAPGALFSLITYVFSPLGY